MKSKAIVVLCTSPKSNSEQLANKILESKLAACVNITSDITSLYWWQGKVQKDCEQMLIIKTSEEHFDRLEDLISSIHPYDVPEIVALPINYGSENYMEWLFKEVSE